MNRSENLNHFLTLFKSAQTDDTILPSKSQANFSRILSGCGYIEKIADFDEHSIAKLLSYFLNGFLGLLVIMILVEEARCFYLFCYK